MTKIHYENGVLYTENGEYKTDIDLVMFGSPCQTFSIAIPNDKRVGLENKEKSGLFLECYRIFNEIKPKYFLMENVASMKQIDKDYISQCLGVQPILINSSKVCSALRKRLYWTNIKNIEEIEDKNINFQSTLEGGYTDRTKARCLAVIDSRPNTTPIKMFHRYYSTGFTTLIFESKKHYFDCVNEYERMCGGKRKIKAEKLDNYNGTVFNGVRYMNQNELERCQTVPSGYTKCLTRNEAADVLGDGWTIDVITHILSFIPKD